MNFSGLNLFLAQAGQDAVAGNPTGDKIKFFIIMATFIAVFWFLMIAPDRKRRKAQESMLNTLKAGDKIVTSSGIIGVVLSIKDKTVSIRSSDAKLEILKSAIGEVTDRGADSTAS